MNVQLQYTEKMEIGVIEKIGIIIVFLDLFWILIYYYYGTVKVYNLKEHKQYEYMGSLWIRRKKGEYCLLIPKEIIEDSYTTQYKIVIEYLFLKWKQYQRMKISFSNKYDVYTQIRKEITVKNHIATSNQL